MDSQSSIPCSLLPCSPSRLSYYRLFGGGIPDKALLLDVPNEILSIMFTYLTTNELLYPVKFLCKRFELIANMNTTWIHSTLSLPMVDLTYYSMASTQFQYNFAKSINQLRYLTLYCEYSSSNINSNMITVLNNCPKLISLSLYNIWLNNTDYTNDNNQLWKIIENLKNLNIFRMQYNISNGDIVSSVKNTLNKCMLLNNLNCITINPGIQYQHFINLDNIITNNKHNTNITYLNLGGIILNKLVIDFISELINLEYLKLYLVEFVSIINNNVNEYNELLLNLSIKLNKLKYFQLGCKDYLDIHVEDEFKLLGYLFNQFKSLQYIYFNQLFHPKSINDFIEKLGFNNNNDNNNNNNNTNVNFENINSLSNRLMALFYDNFNNDTEINVKLLYTLISLPQFKYIHQTFIDTATTIPYNIISRIKRCEKGTVNEDVKANMKFSFCDPFKNEAEYFILNKQDKQDVKQLCQQTLQND